MTDSKDFVVFSGTATKYLAEKICLSLGCPLGNMVLTRFSDGEFAVTFNGQNYGVVKLPNGKSFTVGRRSSDSKAQIQLTPDIAMSRIHAGMRTVQVNGQVVYQITSAKANNPVFVNAMPIAPGKACNLKTGDKVQMGNTILVFRMV